MKEEIDLSHGGTALVLIGNNGFVKEYANHPQVRFVDCHEVAQQLLSTVVPDNTKICVLTEGVPHQHYLWVTAFARRKDIPFIKRNSNQAVYEALKGFFPNGDAVKPTVAEVKETQTKGRLLELFKLADLSKSNAENARALMRVAAEKGIKTTEGSLSQGLAVYRRKMGGTAVPRSAKPELAVALDTLDEAIQSLTQIRDFVAKVEKENSTMKARLARIAKDVSEAE